MKTNGRLIVCDRCGKENFFKTTGDKETDGGFTRWNEFENAEGWSYESFVGDLCPKCTNQYEILKDNFKRFVTEDNEGR